MAKRVQTSADDVTYYTLPGNSGELRNEAGDLTDTIFGQEFESAESGLLSSTLNANALYKGFAGYIVSIKKGGTPVTMTAEACTLVSGKTYQITAATKRIIDTGTTVQVFGNAIAIANTNIETIDWLNGTVTFKAAYTPTTPITITGKYVPTTEIAKAKTFNLSMTAAAVDDTTIDVARANGGYRVFSAGLKTVGLELGGLYALANGHRAALVARTPIIIEINPDNAGQSVARGLFKYISQGQSGDIGASEDETVSFRLQVLQDPVSNVPWQYPFNWYHTSSPLHLSIVTCLNAWVNGNKMYVKYLPDGVAGLKSDAYVTDISLSGGLESMNEFTTNFQLSGAPTVI